MAEETQSVEVREERESLTSTGWRGMLYGLATALSFSISPIFIRRGLEGLESPLLGVTIGMLASTLAYGLILILRRDHATGEPIPRRIVIFQFLAGVLVGLSTWARWLALEAAPVGVVLALGRLNVPVVILLSPIFIGQHLERVNRRVWLGAGLIVAGSLILTFYG